MVELKHPLIVSVELPWGEAGSFYEAHIQVSSSIGHLVSQTENDRAYQMRFRGGDRLKFNLSGAPRGLSISETEGLIAGYLSADSVGKYQLTVTVADESTGHWDEETLELVVLKSQ